jgi:protein TonB
MSHNNGHILSFGISALVHAGVVAALVVGVAASERAIDSAQSEPKEIRVNLASLAPVTPRSVDTRDPADPASRKMPIGRSPELTQPESINQAARKLSGEPTQIAAVARPPARLMAAWVGVSHNVVMPEPAYEPPGRMAEESVDQPSIQEAEPALAMSTNQPQSAASDSSLPISRGTDAESPQLADKGQGSGAAQVQASASEPQPLPQPVQLERLVHPEYPRVSRERGEEGRVVVRVRVTPDGRVADAKIEKSSGHRRLDTAALKAARDCRFEAASKVLADVEAEQVLAFVFRLDQNS